MVCGCPAAPLHLVQSVVARGRRERPEMESIDVDQEVRARLRVDGEASIGAWVTGLDDVSDPN